VRTLATCAIALAFGFFGSMPLAGPISRLVVSQAARGEFDHARRIGWGAAMAEALYAGIAFWDFAALLSRYAFVVPLSHGITAVILVILGVRFAAFVPKEKGDRGENRTGSLLLGFSISALNPTLLVTWSAAVAFLYSKGLGETRWEYAIPFGLGAGAGVALWFTLLVALLRKHEGKVPRARLAQIVRALGVALIALGVWSGVELVRWLRADGDAPKRVTASSCHFVAQALRPRVLSGTTWTCAALSSRWSSTARTTTASPSPSGARVRPSGLPQQT
jgi:threonine/homoserine/homoserine lactone efflux protein